MSTILVDNLTGKTSAGDITVTSEGGAATQSLQQGLAKAWASLTYSGGTPSLDDSLSHSSITDSATGYATMNLTNAMSSINYSTPHACSRLGASAYGWGQTQMNNSAAHTVNTTTAYACVWLVYTISFTDPSQANFSVHGDLA